MKLISSSEVLKTKLFTVTEDRAVDPDGFEIHRLIVRHPGSAVMLAVDEKNRLLLVRQYRLPAEQHLWEIPAGRIDPGERPLEAAKRELEEETGLRARKWTKLLSFYASPGYVGEEMTLYLATDLTAGEQKPMEDERIECRWFAAREVGEMIRAGKLRDGKTIIAFFLWSEHRKTARRTARR